MKHLKLSLLLVITLLMSGCTKESVNESIESIESIENENQLANRPLVLQIPCELDDIILYVTYDIENPDWIEDPQKVREDFRDELREHFTIVSILGNITPGCQHTEKWEVNACQYLDYIGRRNSGTTSQHSKDAGIKTSGGVTSSCFN